MQEEFSGKDGFHVGHDEPLLRLTWGAWIFFPKAQTDLIFWFWATIQHVGMQFPEEAACVQQLASVLAFQLVWLCAVWGEWAMPIYAALAQSLGKDTLGHHPQQHATLQV